MCYPYKYIDDPENSMKSYSYLNMEYINDVD